MLYTVRELADEIAILERTLRDWLTHRVPYTRDRLSRIWIDGKAFTGWVQSQRKKLQGVRLKNDDGYCMTCNRVVVMLNPARYPSTSKLVYIHGICPVCNGKVTRGTWNDSAQ